MNSVLDDILQGHELIKYMVEDGEIYYSREVVMSAKTEYEALKSDRSRLAQENIKLNNNEDFLDGKIASLEARLAEALERNVYLTEKNSSLQKAFDEAAPIMYVHGFWKGT